MAGWQSLGNTIAGGNELPSTLAYEQGVSLGATTQDALAQARQRVDQNNAREHIEGILKGGDPNALIASAVQAGVDPRNLTGAQKDQFDLSQQQSVVNPNTTDDQAGRALAALGKPGIVRAVGDNGNMINELHPSKGVQMSDLGTAIAGSTVDKNVAEAANLNAQVPQHAAAARKDNAIADQGGVKPPNGYAWGPDDPVSGQKTLTQITGGPADINAPKPQGAVEARMMNRSLDAATQSVKDLNQIASLPVGANSGVLGYGATPGKGLLDSLKSDLTNRLAPDEVAQYGVVSSGMSRALASLEAAGGIPSGTFQNSFDKLQILDGDNVERSMLKLAKQRQIVESALTSTITDNPRVPAASKKVAQDLLDQIAKSIPFQPSDVIKLHNGNGQQTLSQAMGLKLPGTAAAPATAPATGAAPSPAALSPDDQPALPPPPPGAIQMLAQHPELKAQFIAKYGALPAGVR